MLDKANLSNTADETSISRSAAEFTDAKGEGDFELDRELITRRSNCRGSR